MFWTTSLFSMFFATTILFLLSTIYMFFRVELFRLIPIILLIFFYWYSLLSVYSFQTFIIEECLGINDMWDNIELNFLLVNTLSVIHPLMLYIAVTFIILSVLISNLHVFRISASIVHTRQILFSYTLICIQILIVTLFLGGWWAHQEGTWGGWWGWDISEVQGLFLLLFSLFFLHKQFKNNSLYFNNLTFVNIFFFHIFFFSIIQIDFSFASHNFGKVLTFANLKEVFFAQVIALICLYWLNNILRYILHNERVLLMLLNQKIKVKKYHYESSNFKWLFMFVCVCMLVFVKVEFLSVTIEFIRNIGIVLAFIYSISFWSKAYIPFNIIYLNQIGLYYTYMLLKLRSSVKAVHLLIIILAFNLFQETHLIATYENKCLTSCNIFFLQFPFFNFSNFFNNNALVTYDKTFYYYTLSTLKANLCCYSYEFAIINVFPAWAEFYYNIFQTSSVQPNIILSFDLLLMLLLLITFTVLRVRRLLV